MAPSVEIADPAVLTLIGTFTGFLAGFIGAGGGFATVVLFLAAGVGVHAAVGTSLAFTILVGAWGTLLHLRQGMVSVPLAVTLGVPSLVTAVLGAQVADALSDRILTLTFATLTGLVATALLVEPRLAAARQRVLARAVAGVSEPARTVEPGTGATAFTPTVRSVAVAVTGGAVIGLLKGLFGVGGGFLLIPFMLLVLRIDERIAVGSSLLAILLGSIGGAFRHATLGNVEMSILLYAVPGGLLGAFIGSRAAETASRTAIRGTFVVVMVASTACLLVTAL